MANDSQQKARADVKRAQSKVERAKTALDKAMAARRASFKRAREAGLSLAEIGDASNLHRSRVDQILREK
jgi:DNA-directed RNA polymerase specialized sigma24 family protein